MIEEYEVGDRVVLTQDGRLKAAHVTAVGIKVNGRGVVLTLLLEENGRSISVNASSVGRLMMESVLKKERTHRDAAIMRKWERPKQC